MPAGSKPNVRFGPFELDARTRELRTSGRTVKLQEQPFQVLTLLLENPGQLVTRDELKARLWASETFVDFESSINKAVNRLREALEDSPGKPKYIETLPRLGYRLVIPVESSHEVTVIEEANLNANRVSGSAVKEAAATVAPNTAERPAEAAPIRRWSLAIGLAGGLLLLIAILSLVLTRPLPPPKVLDTVQITNDGRQKMGMVTDGARIYFVEVSAGGTVLAQVAASGGETVVIPTPVEIPTILDISPARSELLISGQQFLGESPLTILPIPAGSPRRLGDVIGHDGTWSPDGRRILYASGSDIYSAKSDGTESRKLVTTPGVPRSPRWSPDGRKLRFTVLDTKTNSASIWEVSADGANLHPLLPGGTTRPRNVVGVGRQMENITSCWPTGTAGSTYGPSAKRMTSFERQIPSRFN